jgi:cyclic beta-1,2-glucan synthetase
VLGGEEICSGNPCAAIQIALCCDAHQGSKAHFFLGIEEGALVNYDKASSLAIEHINQLRDPIFLAEQKKLLDERYKKHFSHFTCNIPDKVCERQINIWGPLNALQFSLFHQTPQPSAPGVRCIGVRDKIQALMPIVYKNPEGVKEGLLFMLSVQYPDGAIAHNVRGFMNEFGKPGKYNRNGIKSDDHLWIPFLAYSLAAETNTEFLNIDVPYCDLDGEPSQKTETVWQHLMRIIDFTQSNLGAHGLPLMLDGDWNDIISKFSHKGRGESVFAGEQYVAALRKLIEMAERRAETRTRLPWRNI